MAVNAIARATKQVLTSSSSLTRVIEYYRFDAASARAFVYSGSKRDCPETPLSQACRIEQYAARLSRDSNSRDADGNSAWL
jgi:hypothetical protein